MMRPYVAGDDVRRIDWNVTARTGEPHVRVDLAERVLVTWLVLDTLRVDAVRHRRPAEGRRRGGRRRRDRSPVHAAREPPRRRHVRRKRRRPRFLHARGASASSACSPRCAASPPTEGRERGRSPTRSAATGALARQRSLVVVVSDFRGDARVAPAAAPARGAPRRRRRRDPRSARAGAVRTSGSSGSSIPRPDGSCASTRAAVVSASASRSPRRPSGARCARSFSSIGVRHVVLSTSGDWLRPLVTFLRRSRA